MMSISCMTSCCETQPMPPAYALPIAALASQHRSATGTPSAFHTSFSRPASLSGRGVTHLTHSQSPLCQNKLRKRVTLMLMPVPANAAAGARHRHAHTHTLFALFRRS